MNNQKMLAKASGPNSKAMKEYKESLLSLTKEQKEASIGLVLGDASLQTQNNGKTFRLKFEWGDKNKPYLDHIHNLFNEWVLSEPHKKSRMSPNGNLVVNWGFQTISHEAFNFLSELFYPGSVRVKSIATNLIRDHLTARGLAFWFCDDGGKLDYNLNSKNRGIVLNTQSFAAAEVELMSTQLALKFDLECEVRSNKGKKVIVIKSNSFPTFLSLIDPYIIPEMRYKLP